MELEHNDLRVAACGQAMTKKVIRPHHSARKNIRSIIHLQVAILENKAHALEGMLPKEEQQPNKRAIKHSNKSSETRWSLKLTL